MVPRVTSSSPKTSQNASLLVSTPSFPVNLFSTSGLASRGIQRFPIVSQVALLGPRSTLLMPLQASLLLRLIAETAEF